jgi:hypothetical protein
MQVHIKRQFIVKYSQENLLGSALVLFVVFFFFAMSNSPPVIEETDSAPLKWPDFFFLWVLFFEIYYR